MTFNAIDAKSVCCRRSTAIGDQKAKTSVGPESDCRFSFATVRSTSCALRVPLVLGFIGAPPDALPAARSWVADLRACFLTCSALFTSAFVVEADLASLRFDRLDDGFLRLIDLI